ncbi:MAG: hypothetical protein HYZ28_27710 [Myxococcales bacterium]|nr:hypothetical protein [Myxococcales bacterium]
MTRNLGQRLLEEGLITRFALDQVRAKVGPKEEVSDALVAHGAIQEADLLRFLARELNTRFVSSDKLAAAIVPALVLAVVPVAKAEACCALPIALQADRRVLSVVMADPQKAHALDELPSVARMQQLNAYVGLPRAIRAAIRKHYYRDSAAFAPAEPAVETACPSCGSPVGEDQLECASCGLLLNPDACSGRREVSEISVVRALMAEPGGDTGRFRNRLAEKTDPKLPVQVDADSVPVLVAGLEEFESRLSPFEAFLVAFSDGESGLGQLAGASGVAEVEVYSVFASLAERGFVRLRPRPSRPPAGPLDPLPSDGSPAEVANLLQQAIALERKGKPESAVALLKQGIARAKQPAPLYNRLAIVVLHQRRDYAEAEELLHRALELEPDNGVYGANLMKVLALAAAHSGKKKVSERTLRRLRRG